MAIRMTNARRRRKGATIQPLRLVLCTCFALALAVVLLLQAASSVLARKQPELAVRLFPLNGLALERAAYRSFLAGVKGEADLVPSARQAADLARRAAAREALTPNAHGILALAAADPARRDAILAAASTTNRRNLFMQGLALDRYVEQGNFPDTLATLDRLLRVHPEQKRYFFPILTRALQDERSLPAFAEVLDGSSDWHLDFLRRSALEEATLDNFVRLRGQLALRDEAFDRRLILRLAQTGRYDTAYAIYRSAADGRTSSRTGAIPWTSTFAPFEWKLANEAGFRAQATPEGDQLEVFVRSGQGGILAERVLAANPQGFDITVDHALNPPDQVRDVRLQLRCSGSGSPFFDQRFVEGTNRFAVDQVPAGCDYLLLAIRARAWSGRSQISGTIGELRIEPR